MKHGDPFVLWEGSNAVELALQLVQPGQLMKVDSCYMLNYVFHFIMNMQVVFQVI